MLNKLKQYLVKPELDVPGTNVIWTDEHISKGMLASHLDPVTDAASRTFEFMDKSVEWIYSVAPPDKYKDVLDLGCGPGLYAERFYGKGYNVTGVDFSERSIAYAKNNAGLSEKQIEYKLQNYLSIEYENAFDIAVIISYDFCVLSKSNRKLMLEKIRKALRRGGKFIFDVTTLNNLVTEETHKWAYHPDGCFVNGKPHICLDSTYYYEEDDTNLTRTIALTEDEFDCFHIWLHNFTEAKLIAELRGAGFTDIELYGDVSGSVYKKGGDSITIVATK